MYKTLKNKKMDAISQLPGLFKQMEGEQGSKLMENLMRFTMLINNMSEDQLVSFYQALLLFGESQPKGNIFSRTSQYKMLEKVKKFTRAKMLQMLKKSGNGYYANLDMINKFKKAVPNIWS